jgi:hypothetical protein
LRPAFWFFVYAYSIKRFALWAVARNIVVPLRFDYDPKVFGDSIPLPTSGTLDVWGRDVDNHKSAVYDFFRGSK